MYNCRKLYQRLLSSVTFDNLVQFNSNIIRQESISSFNIRYFCYNKNFSAAQVKVKRLGKDNISNYDDLINYVANVHRVEMKHISEMFNKIENDILTEEHVLFLLECCGKLIPGETLNTKHEICVMVLKKFESHLNYSDKVYQTFIKVCTENKQILDVDQLISSLKNNISFDLLKLLLKNVCERGDTNKALKVLTEIKNRGYGADHQVFNDLTLCHTIKGGFALGQSVVQTMIMAKLDENNETRFAIIKGLAQRSDSKEFLEALDKFSVEFSENMVLDLLESLGFSENYVWMKYITKSLKRELFSKRFPTEVEKLCIKLVHNKKYASATEIYKAFIDPKPDVKYGLSLLREMLICSAPMEQIVEFAKTLKDSGLNKYALEHVTDLAMKYKLTISALRLLKHFDTLRPHYFWPILIKAHASRGEKGLMEVMQDVNDMKVKFDSDSFQNYIFPRCDLKNPRRVIEMFQSLGYTVKTLLTPMLVILLKQKEMKLTLETCNSYGVQIGSQNLLEILPYTWIDTVDHNVCLSLIQKMSESKSEVLLGIFLTEILSKLRNPGRLRPFLLLLKDSKHRKLAIDTVTADILINTLKKKFPSSDIMPELEDAINDLLDFTLTTNSPLELHPSDINTEELECHLIELKAKGMETRGVIRKLIQKSANEGNSERIKDLQGELISKQYISSPGMKASMLHIHVKEENLSDALKLYEELKLCSPGFKLDLFKLIDLATLLVRHSQFDKAVDILLQEAKQRNMQTGKYLQRNCRVLLSSIQNMEQQKIMFEVITENGYCEPSNIILGTIIELHLKKDNLKNTVDIFVDFAQKYRQTPMQVVIICETLESGNQELLQIVLDATASVHGTGAAHSALISALCEKGYKNQLIALLKDSQLNPLKSIEIKCDRWMQLEHLEPLETLLEVSRQISPTLLNRSKIQLCIMQVYSRKNDCDGALEFWKSLVDNEDLINVDVDMEFYNLLERCKYELPENLELKYRIK